MSPPFERQTFHCTPGVAVGQIIVGVGFARAEGARLGLTCPQAVPIMPEMSDHDFRTVVDALCARFQADLQAQATELASRHTVEREKLAQEAEIKQLEDWLKNNPAN